MPANGITSTKLDGKKKKIPRSSQGTIVSHELILHLGHLKRFRFFPPERYGLNLYKYENLFREVIVKDTCQVNKFSVYLSWEISLAHCTGYSYSSIYQFPCTRIQTSVYLCRFSKQTSLTGFLAFFRSKIQTKVQFIVVLKNTRNSERVGNFEFLELAETQLIQKFSLNSVMISERNYRRTFESNYLLGLTEKILRYYKISA